jgi:hypothetical protein
MGIWVEEEQLTVESLSNCWAEASSGQSVGHPSNVKNKLLDIIKVRNYIETIDRYEPCCNMYRSKILCQCHFFLAKLWTVRAYKICLFFCTWHKWYLFCTKFYRCANYIMVYIQLFFITLLSSLSPFHHNNACLWTRMIISLRRQCKFYDFTLTYCKKAIFSWFCCHDFALCIIISRTWVSAMILFIEFLLFHVSVSWVCNWLRLLV